MTKNILIVIGAVAYNRGSEALLRALCNICKNKYKNSIITVAQAEDNFKELNITKSINKYLRITNYSRKSILGFFERILKKFKIPTEILIYFKYSKLKKIAKTQDIIIIVGADNIDASIDIQKETKLRNSYIKKNTHAKMILYDCSLNKKNATDTLKQDLQNFDVITARDSISLENLKSIAGKKEILYYPDPAFSMKSKETKLPSVFNENGVIGINASDIFVDYGEEKYKNLLLKAYQHMINTILEETKENIVLIPHVMNNKDLSILKLIYESYENNSRVYLIENEKLNAKELKYIISKCDLYIGARTHSTIAAYSTEVPTIVLGYSIKSKGIAKDLFGTYENYVLSLTKIKEKDLSKNFRWLYKNKNKIKSILEQKMPKYIEKAKQFEEVL